MSLRRCTGQAAAEYVAVLLVAGAVLAGAATAAFAVPGLGPAVARTVRTGLCLVGGDVCRPSDAAAAGLEPCVTRARVSSQDAAIDVAVVRFGGHGEWLLALRSDGSAAVTRVDDTELGGTVGVGVEAFGLDAAVGASLTARYRSGRAWRFPSAAAAARFLAGAEGGPAPPDRPPDVRWDALGGGGAAGTSASLAALAGLGLSVGADGAVGLRRDGDLRTLTLDLGIDEPQFAGHLPGFPRPAAGRRAVFADVTWEAGGLRDLTVRSVAARDGRYEELIARIDLREPQARALAERLLRPGGGLRGDLEAVAAHAAAHGVVERNGYTVRDRRRGFSVAVKLVVGLGFSTRRVQVERRLTDAVAWIRGGPPMHRMDCLGV